LDGLRRQTIRPERFEVHVVDSGADRTRALTEELARDWKGRLTYHDGGGGQGPGAKRNLGARQTSAPYLAFTDADCVPEPQWLEAGLAHLRGGASIVQGPTLTPNGSPPPAFSHAIFRPGPSPLFESCNIMFSSRAFDGAGGFSVDLFDATGSPLGEDTELAWQIRRARGKAVFEPRAVVRHSIRPESFAHHLRYEWQTRFFPRLVRRVPELRSEGLTAGVFLGRRSLHSWGALAGLALGRRNRCGYLLAAPYLLQLVRGAAATGDPAKATIVATGQLMADATRQAALIWGSLRYRSLVL
jgi:glycosyltransferase involved in cell wall biosynthesis